MRLPGEGDATVIGDVLGELPCSGLDGAVVIVGAKEGNHGAASVSGAGIVDDWFEAVAHLDAVFALIRGDEEEHAAIVFFAADAQMFVEIGGVVFDGLVLEVVNGNDGHLCTGFLFELGAELFERVFGPGTQRAGEIGYVAGGRDLGNVLCAGDGR